MKKNNDRFYYIESVKGKKSDLVKLPKEPFIAIVLVLTWGLLYHKFARGKKAVLYFTHKVNEDKIKLTYLKSTRDCSFHDVNMLMSELYRYAKENNVKSIETLIVNPFITQKILERDGWVFEKREWIVGRLNSKKLL